MAKGDFLFRQGRYDAAIEAFERAAPLVPDNVLPHDGLGLSHARLGNFDAAIRAHERAVEMEPDNAHAWTNFAETLIRVRRSAARPRRGRAGHGHRTRRIRTRWGFGAWRCASWAMRARTS